MDSNIDTTLQTTLKVKRFGKQKRDIKSDKLVVGDLIKIEKGMRIPADCILVRSKDESIVLDQKQLNVGESKFSFYWRGDYDYTAVELESALGTNNFSGKLPFLLSHTFVK